MSITVLPSGVASPELGLPLGFSGGTGACGVLALGVTAVGKWGIPGRDSGVPMMRGDRLGLDLCGGGLDGADGMGGMGTFTGCCIGDDGISADTGCGRSAWFSRLPGCDERIGIWDDAEGCVSDGCDGINMGTGWGGFAWFGELPMGVESVTTGEKGGVVRLELARGGCDCAQFSSF